MKSKFFYAALFAVIGVLYVGGITGCDDTVQNPEIFGVEKSDLALLSYPVDISATVTTMPDPNTTVLDHGMVPLNANTTVIEGCAFVFKLNKETGDSTITAPFGYTGEITFTVTGNKTDGYTVQISDNIAGYVAVINEVYFGVGNNARKFSFDPSITYASPLPAPLNPANQPANISHTHFCYDIIEENGDWTWIGETAWAANGNQPGSLRYNISTNRRGQYIGNWATFVAYEGVEKTVTLFAGQTMDAGTVKFEPYYDDVKITITLHSGWRLEDVYEAVKIQGYYTSPQSYENPAPGLFTTYKGNDLQLVVPHYNYYGVHVNVEYQTAKP